MHLKLNLVINYFLGQILYLESKYRLWTFFNRLQIKYKRCQSPILTKR